MDYVNEIEKKYIGIQKELCRQYGTEYFEAPFGKFIGVAKQTFTKDNFPVNGLRHPPQSIQSTNWFVWCGEYSEAADFFQPIHIYHLLETYPKVIEYLGLPPGWRFLFAPNYEDVWFDENLLKIARL